MKTRRRFVALGVVALGLAVVQAPAPRARAQAPVQTWAGLDIAWIKGKYGSDLTNNFDAADWKRELHEASVGGARIVRVWLLEGAPMQGVLWGADPHEPVGVDPQFLQNIASVAAIASDEGLQVYWTGLDGNVPGSDGDPLSKDRFWNVYNNEFGFGDEFRSNVLGPILDVVNGRPDVTYGFDLINEVEGAMAHGLFANQVWTDRKWDAPRAFIQATVAFAHARAPGLAVTASAGWSGPDDIIAGRFDGLGLDLYDVHVYTDATTIPSGDAVAAHVQAQGRSIVLGEFGQASSTANPTLQAQVTAGLLADAQRLGFAAALAWRIEDEGDVFTFFDANGARPALGVIHDFTAAQR